jgi:hypothetical protein
MIPIRFIFYFERQIRLVLLREVWWIVRLRFRNTIHEMTLSPTKEQNNADRHRLAVLIR